MHSPLCIPVHSGTFLEYLYCISSDYRFIMAPPPRNARHSSVALWGCWGQSVGIGGPSMTARLWCITAPSLGATTRPQRLKILRWHWECAHQASKSQSKELKTLPPLVALVRNSHFQHPGNGQPLLPPAQLLVDSIPFQRKDELVVGVHRILSLGLPHQRSDGWWKLSPLSWPPLRPMRPAPTWLSKWAKPTCRHLPLLIFCDHLTDLVLHFESHELDLVCSLSWLYKIVSHKGWEIYVRLMKCYAGIL